MANYLVTDAELSSIANAIREKTGTSLPLAFPEAFVTAIGDISGGNIQPLSVSSNGTYNLPEGVDGFAPVTVNVSGGGPETSTECLITGTMSFVSYQGFKSNSYITQAYLPNCSAIVQEGFQYCENLSIVSFPICTAIGSAAFYSTGLISISIPLCSYIDGEVFERCSKLTDISLPECDFIGHLAFCDCVKLESVYLMSSSMVELAASNAFDATPLQNSSYLGRYGSIYVPASLYNAYIQDSEWSHFSARITSYTP